MITSIMSVYKKGNTLLNHKILFENQHYPAPQ